MKIFCRENDSIEMISCDICDVEFEHRLELVEHQSSLSHQIKVGINLQKGAKRECPVCNFSCPDLSEYSKHVDSDSHLSKLRALRSKRIAMVDSNIPCLPFKKNSRFDSPAFYPANMQQPPPPLPSHHWQPPPIQSNQQIQPSHFNSFFRPSIHSKRPPLNHNERKGDGPTVTPIHPQQHKQHPGPSNRKPIYTKDNRRTGQSNNGKGPSPKGKKEEIKKKKGGVISKVLSSSSAIIKKKKEIVTTPKVTSMENKNKRYESLALKGAGMVMASNKSRTQVMMMERQVKYSLVERQSIEDTRGNASLSSIPSMAAPPPIPFSPPPHPSSSSHNISFTPSSISDSTYAFCHPVHSTPHQLHDSNWPEFVRGMNALDDDTPSSSTIHPSNTQTGSYAISGKGTNTIKIKEELQDDEEEISIIPINRPIKEEPSTCDQSSSTDYLKILENKKKWEIDQEEYKRKMSILSCRREESRRRFDEEMRQIDEEERIEKEKMSVLAAAHASFQKGLRKFVEAHGL